MTDISRLVDWRFDAWPAIEPTWSRRQSSEWDRLEFHVDLGCGTVKKGRIGVDRFLAPGVDVIMDLDRFEVHGVAMVPGAEPRASPRPQSFGLPFDDNSIESIIAHHALEHIGDGFIRLVDEVYRVLKPGAVLRAITPLFPSSNAVADPDHRRYFTENTWDSFCGHLGDENNPTGSWLDSFSVPYTRARFKMLEKQTTPWCEPEKRWGPEDDREIRVALEAVKR